MEKEKLGKYTALIAVSSAIGILAGIYTARNGSAEVISVSVFNGFSSWTSFFRFALRSFSSTMLQFTLIFASGMSLFPSVSTAAVFTFRGFFAGFSSFALFSSQNAFSSVQRRCLVSIIAYAAATLLMAYLAKKACSFSVRCIRQKKNGALELLPSYLYTFMMTSGASLIIRILPDLINCKLK